MNNWKAVLAYFGMFLVLLVIGVMLWNKNNLKRAEELKNITDYIVEANFKHQIEREEGNFIKLMAALESKVIFEPQLETLHIEFQVAKGLAYALAPYSTEVELNKKIRLVDCLEELSVNSKKKSCVEQYALTTTQKATK